VLSFAILPEYFPREMSARANAALNILHLSGAFALQYPPRSSSPGGRWFSGRPPAEAFEAAFGLSVILQLLALLWFLATARMATVPSFSASRPSRARPLLRPLCIPAGRRDMPMLILRFCTTSLRCEHRPHIGDCSASVPRRYVQASPRWPYLATRPNAIVHVVEAPAFVAAADDRRPAGTGLLVVSVSDANGADTR
jgi:hypothetical protein